MKQLLKLDGVLIETEAPRYRRIKRAMAFERNVFVGFFSLLSGFLVGVALFL